MKETATPKTDCTDQQIEFCVLLGAHKTATTYIQRVLNNNRGLLADHGVQVLLPSNIRGKIGLRLPSLACTDEENYVRCADTSTKITKLIETTPGIENANRIVFSEENLIGSCKTNLFRGDLYPDIFLRLSLLPRWMNSENVTFFFSVRSFAEFFSSNYTTVMKGGTVLDREKLAVTLLKKGRGWFDVIMDLSTVFPRANVCLWRYEDFAAIESALLESISGIPLKPDDTIRPNLTLSEEAVLWMEQKLNLGTKDTSGKVARQAASRFPINLERTAFCLWKKSDRLELDKAYVRDWNAITKTWPNALLKPDLA